MKSRISKSFFVFLPIIILSISILIFNNSCQKSNNQNPGKTIVSTGSNIVYTDLNRDSVILDSNSQRQYNLDLNNDGIIDFVFTEIETPTTPCRDLPTGSKYSGHVKPASGSNNAIIYELSIDIARPLDSLSVIDSNSNWTYDSLNKLLYLVVTGSPALSQCNPNSGAWFNSTDKYLGLKFIKDGNIYYGWARLHYGIAVASLTLKDYAYDSIPNQQILAGQTK